MDKHVPVRSRAATLVLRTPVRWS